MKQYKLVIGLGWSLLTNAVTNNIRNYVENGGIFVAPLTFTHTNKDVDDLELSQAWSGNTTSLFGVQVAARNENEGIIADAYLYNIEFTTNTFWYPLSGTYYYYSYFNPTWFWKFNYAISPTSSARVIAWVNGQTAWPNAFIIENKVGRGYTYVMNSRNLNSLPNGDFNDALCNFLNRLCSYFVKPTLGLVYPAHEGWLAEGQANEVVYLLHDNSTVQYSFKYNVSLSEPSLNPKGQYLILDWTDGEFLGVKSGPLINLTITLQPNASKLIYFKEYTGRPELLYANLPVTGSFQDQLHYGIDVSNISADQTNSIQIYAGSSRPRDVQVNGIPISTWSYNAETGILTINYKPPDGSPSESVFNIVFEENSGFNTTTIFLGAIAFVVFVAFFSVLILARMKRKKGFTDHFSMF